MDYEEWINRPVYKAQVYTANIAKALLGLPGGDIATKGNHPFLYFRIQSKYRCPFSLALRKAVAHEVKLQRKNGTYKLLKVQ